MATRFSISKEPLSLDKIHQMKDIWHQYYVLNGYKRSHDTENHCGYLMYLFCDVVILYAINIDVGGR